MTPPGKLAPRKVAGAAVTAFHGTDVGRGAEITRTGEFPADSDSRWNWLGTGVYFWQENPERALQWATGLFGTNAMVFKAKIRLGRCLDLQRGQNLEKLKWAYEDLKAKYDKEDRKLPSNDGSKHDLDCLVVDHLCSKLGKIDTVRSSFEDGPCIYEGSSFRSLTHTQIAVRNRACIIGTPIEEGMEVPWR